MIDGMQIVIKARRRDFLGAEAAAILEAPVDQQHVQTRFRQIAAKDQPMMAGADDDAVIGLFQSLGHAVLPLVFCDGENSKFPDLRTQIFAWPDPLHLSRPCAERSRERSDRG